MKQGARLVIMCLTLCGLGACDGSGFTDIVSTNQATVRFVNAISGLNSSLALTANGSLVGTAQPFGQVTTTCTQVNTGSTEFVYGTPNSSGTDVATSFATATFPLTSGNYLVVATGSTTTPQFLILRATTTAAPAGTVNVRFVNATSLTGIDVTASGGAAQSVTVSNIAAFSASAFSNIAMTDNTLTFTTSGTGSTAFTVSNVAFQSGGNYTIVLLPSASGIGFQVLIINGACS